MREPGLRLQGATAACVNCHRRSGLGMKEGRRTIPPIAASYLFHPRAVTADDLDLPFVEGMRADRDPYTEETLTRAIRSGTDAAGWRAANVALHAANSALLALLVIRWRSGNSTDERVAEVVASLNTRMDELGRAALAEVPERVRRRPALERAANHRGPGGLGCDGGVVRGRLLPFWAALAERGELPGARRAVDGGEVVEPRVDDALELGIGEMLLQPHRPGIKHATRLEDAVRRALGRGDNADVADFFDGS